MALHTNAMDALDWDEVKPIPPGKMTEEVFVAWCGDETRAEWVDGEVVMMTPDNTEHSELSTWLLRLLGDFVERRKLGVILHDVFVRFPEHCKRRVPDILFLAKESLARLHPTCVEGPPELIVEIVSPDSQARDWREKYLEYEAAGVQEYWIIDPMSQRMEAYSLSAAGAQQGQPSAERRYERVEEKDGWTGSQVLPGFRLRTAWLWPETRPPKDDALREVEKGFEAGA